MFINCVYLLVPLKFADNCFTLPGARPSLICQVGQDARHVGGVGRQGGGHGAPRRRVPVPRAAALGPGPLLWPEDPQAEGRRPRGPPASDPVRQGPQGPQHYFGGDGHFLPVLLLRRRHLDNVLYPHAAGSEPFPEEKLRTGHIFGQR